MKITIIKGDITEQDVDGIVNAANTGLRGGGGVDGAIHRAAGPALAEECRKIRETQGGCPTGEAVLTGAGDLPAEAVIHTPGPVWHGGDRGEAEKLAACHRNSLRAAEENGLRSVAFPAISCGVYGYPVEKAARVALETVASYESDTLDDVRFVLYGDREYRAYCQAREEMAPDAPRAGES